MHRAASSASQIRASRSGAHKRSEVPGTYEPPRIALEIPWLRLLVAICWPPAFFTIRTKESGLLEIGQVQTALQPLPQTMVQPLRLGQRS